LLNGNARSKYYPSADTDPYNQDGLVWFYGGLEIVSLLGALPKGTQFAKACVDGILEQVSQLLERLEDQGIPPAAYGLLRQYGYGDLVDEAIARNLDFRGGGDAAVAAAH
jgi:hypothetical protein